MVARVLTAALLATAHVLWRQPDTLALWAIPHPMRPGQSPRDLWENRLRPDERKRAVGWHGATQVSPGPLDGWMYLGSPGWWGNLSEDEQRTVEAFLAPLRAAGCVPTHPNEWCEVRRNNA